MAAEANNVTLSTNFNVDPYYDDFDETKNYHRMLFRPGLAVQARELTQMQTILQNQIDRFASHIFKEGSIVSGVDINYNKSVDYVKLRDKTSTGASVNVFSFLDKTIKDNVHNLRAKVIKVVPGSEANTPNFNTLYIQYLSGNTTTGRTRYSNNSILTVVGNTAITSNTITSAQGGAVGYGSFVTIGGGIVYAKDHFIRVSEQTVIVSPYGRSANARVGFEILETIVTEQSDDTLLDPAQGSYNYAAPGAARLKLEADIKSIGLTEPVSNNFVELVNIKLGVVTNLVRAPQYSAIRDYMAGRTFDESGNYVVRGFNTKLREHLKTLTNDGVYRISENGDSNFLVIELDPGKAYVKGYDIENLVTTRTSIGKATDFIIVESAKALIDYGNYIEVDNVVGNWDLNYQGTVTLRDTQANAVVTTSGGIGNYSLTSFPGNSIGTARVRGFEYSSGTPGLPNARYRMYLTDITMNAGKSFANAQSVAYNSGTGYANGKADIVASNGLNANTQDASFDRAIFELPATSIKRLRNASGNINNDFSFYKSFDITFNNSGVATINTGDNSETFDGTGVLSDAATRTDFYIVSRASANSSTLTGTISVTSGSNTVTGSGTSFNTQVNPGDIIHVSNNTDYVVSEVSSPTSLKIHRNATASRTGVSYFKKFRPGQVLDLGGVGRDGTRTITISGTPSTVATIDLNESLGASLAATAVVTLNKIDGQEASKAVVRNRLVQIRVGAGGGTSYTANTTGPWPLGLSDGFKLVSVRKKTGSNFASTTEGTDVTSHFTLDTGMRDNYYDHARLVKKSTSSLSISSGDRFLVKLDHFTHSFSTGVGYFSVDSYPVNDASADVDTTKIYTYEIPIFTSPTTGKAFDLRNCIDIRPRVSDTSNSVSALSGISINPLTSTSFAQPSGGLHFSPPAQDFTTDLEYYLKRNDVISLTQSGRLNVTRGVPSLNPVTPISNDDAMAIATVELAAYPSLPREEAIRVGRPDLSNVIRRIKNERFTMKDIGVLRDRIDRLEYLTSLTLLEKNSKDLLIPDEFGNDRFKNGILVDGFTGHNIGNVFDADYKISIDLAKKEARPPFTTNNIELFYDSASTNVVRTNVTPAGVSRDQVVAISNSAISFTSGETVSSGASSGVLRFKVNNKLYIEEATGNFAAAATITGATSGSSATISSVTTTAPGDLVTLPYTHRALAVQPYATTTRNCAGTFYRWTGTLILSPDNDYWCDTVLRPELSVNINSNLDNWENVVNPWQTAWSAWQTTFTGVPADAGTIINDVQVVTTDRSLIGATQFRTATRNIPEGFETKLEKKGEFVTDTNIQPYMRSRLIKCKLVGMKASARLYAFFDGIPVSSYITPLTQSEYESAEQTLVPAAAPGSALTTDSEGNAYCTFRIPSDVGLKFKTGARRLRFVDNPTNSTTFGTFTTAAEAEYTAGGLTTGVGELTTSTRNPLTTTFKITERRTFVLREYNPDPAPDPGPPPPPPPPGPPPPPPPGPPLPPLPPEPPEPAPPPAPPPEPPEPPTPTPPDPPQPGPEPFPAPDPVPAPDPEPAPTGGGKDDSGGGTGGDDNDPIAQTFFVASRVVSGISTSGLYLSKIDLFFATKDETLPVIIQIHEVEPLSSTITSKVVPFGRVIVPSSAVNVSEDGSKPTPIYFPSPVHLESNREYAIVVIPGGVNPNYSVFSAVIGETDILTGSKISEQPASGFMFTSANTRTWVPVENEDMKYTLYYANFDTSSYGYMIVKPERREYMTIANQAGGQLYRAGEVVHGETLILGAFSNTKSVNTSGSVLCYAQGMTSNAYGVITSWSSSKIRVKNIGPTKFRGGERVRIRNTNGTTGVIIGNTTSSISTTTPVGRISFYDPISFSNTKLHLSNSSYINSGPAATNNRTFVANTWIRGQSSNGTIARIVSLDRITVDNMNLFTSSIVPSNSSISAFAKLATSNSTRDSTYIRVNLNADTEFSSPRYILSRSVESNTSLSSATMASTRSAEIAYVLDCRNRLGSPAIDLNRISLIVTNNMISSNAEIGSSEDNVASGGNSKTRYISRTVTLADGQDAEDLLVYLSAYKPATAEIYVYYKILHREDSDSFVQARWVLMERDIEQGKISTTRYSSSENKEDFFEMTFKVPDYANAPRSGANTASGIVEYRNSKRARFVGYKYFAIKVVMTNSSSSNPPRIRELRAIALQK